MKLMTSNEKIYQTGKLYQKMEEEQSRYRNWLLGMAPEEVLCHAYEYTIKQDILFAMEYTELSSEQVDKLLTSETPLDDVYREYNRYGNDYMEMIGIAIQNT